ncbi:MAG: copper chaperone [Saprospiraceae bacterium]|jgi:copper chaperone|uniref:heavy-metal-associated domain-containing protein n=1 Tax=Candidatus Marifrigoribacter sp. Uisw_064 TaxID=3230970 RepID=UPI003AE18D6E
MKSTLVIQNLKCGGCANTITTKISSLEYITDVEVDVETSSVSFTFQNANELQKVKEKLAHLGYPIDGDKNSVVSKAISYVSCATGKMSN